MYTIFLFLLTIFTNERTIQSLKSEIQAKIQVFGPEIIKPIDNKTKKKISKEEKINQEIIKNNSYYRKKITIKDLFLVEIKEKRIVFRNFDNNLVNYIINSKKTPDLKYGVKYKVKGYLLVFSDIMVFEFIDATRLF